jgi:small-conductance mechanosensitive channel
VQQLVSFGFGLVELAAVLVCAAFIARALRRALRPWLSARLVPENAKRIAENGVSLGIYAVAVTLLFTFWGVTWSTLLTAIGISTLVVALGLQGVLQSLIAGIFILFERPYNVGDRVSFSVHDVEGTVEDIALRTTVIRTEDGTRVVAPNSFVLTQAVVNHSPDRAVLTIVTVHGAGGSDRSTDQIRSLVEEALAEVDGFTAKADIVVRTRFAKLRAPRPIVRFPRLGAWADRLVQSVKDQTTQVRVSWYGLNDRAVLDEVSRRLKELFPDSSVAVRRW